VANIACTITLSIARKSLFIMYFFVSQPVITSQQGYLLKNGGEIPFRFPLIPFKNRPPFSFLTCYLPVISGLSGVFAKNVYSHSFLNLRSSLARNSSIASTASFRGGICALVFQAVNAALPQILRTISENRLYGSNQNPFGHSTGVKSL